MQAIMRQYPQIYSQRDPQWSGQRLGTVDGSTIGVYGCIVTCMADKAGYYGHPITPNALDDIFTQRSIYLDGNLLPDAGITQVFPDIGLQKVYDFASVPADMGLLHQLAGDETITVTLELDFDHDPADGIQTHFVELHSYDGSTLTIYDPWYGQDNDFSLHYGADPATTILKFAVYKGAPAHAVVELSSDKFEELVTKSTDRDRLAAAGYPTSADVLKKVGDLQNANTQLIQDVQQARSDAASATTQAEAFHSQESSLASQLLDAQHQLAPYQKTRQMVTDQLGLLESAPDADIFAAIEQLRQPDIQTAKHVQQLGDALMANGEHKTPPPSPVARVRSFFTDLYQRVISLRGR